MPSALHKRLLRLEELLAAKLTGPQVIIWLKEGEDLATVVEAKITAGEIPPNARPQAVSGWRERRGEERPGPLVKGVRWLNESEAKQQPEWEEPAVKEPLALPAPLKRLAFEGGSAQQLETEADPPENPCARRRAVVLPKQKDKFHLLIDYPTVARKV